MNKHWLAAALVLGIFAGMSALAAGPASDAALPETKWEELVPKDWDPTQRFRNADVGALSDTHPKVLQMMRELRESWDNAPTNGKLDGKAVRLPGYVVPLDEVNGQIKEFLLVPYFGACIHTPPPPANQIIYVKADKPPKGFRSMDTVWVSGTLKTLRSDSYMGASGYRMDAVVVERYLEPK